MPSLYSKNMSNLPNPEDYRKALESLCISLGVEPEYWQLFLEPVTHSSFSSERRTPWSCSERIEFLGDSVVGLVISEFLYRNCHSDREGAMALKKSSLVSTDSLACEARKIGLDRFILMSNGERKNGGCKKNSVLADLYESVIGAVFLCKGWNFASKLVLGHFSLKLSKLSMIGKDAKTALQELTQKRFKEIPVYNVVETGSQSSGTDRFKAEAVVCGKTAGTGCGASKKEAETAAAAEALAAFGVF